MRVTVAICTWNRCEVLRQGLEQMTRLIIPNRVEWELLLVNNSCTDATDAVAKNFSGRLPLHYLREPQPGLSRARNAAVREAGGRYILWTDDDTLVDERWLASYVEAFDRWPDAVFFGGPVLPMFTVPPPHWLKQAWPNLKTAYAERNLSDEPFRMTAADRFPFGANYAVRMAEHRNYRYDLSLGHHLTSRIGGEETALLSALMTAGGSGWWVPGAQVRHLISPERMTIRYIREYFVGYGCGLQTQECNRMEQFSFIERLNALRRLLLKAIRKEVRFRRRRWLSSPEVWSHHLVEASIARGRFVQASSWIVPTTKSVQDEKAKLRRLQ